MYYHRALGDDLPEPDLPSGYTLRPVDGIPELYALHSAATFAAVNPAHQQECFESGEYSHMVVVPPEGGLAAYCECSVDRVEWQGGGQKIGWIDYVETLAAHQGKGLGQAVLWAGLKRLQAWGAEKALLVQSQPTGGGSERVSWSKIFYNRSRRSTRQFWPTPSARTSTTRTW